MIDLARLANRIRQHPAAFQRSTGRVIALPVSGTVEFRMMNRAILPIFRPSAFGRLEFIGHVSNVRGCRAGLLVVDVTLAHPAWLSWAWRIARRATIEARGAAR